MSINDPQNRGDSDISPLRATTNAPLAEIPGMREVTQRLSFLAGIAIAPDRQIRIEVHPSRQSLESFQVHRTKIKIQWRSRHTTSW
jgi:hypothetical protein